MKHLLKATWRRIASSERRTQYCLLKRGFLSRKEPPFALGRKPDFLTFGRGKLWVEVKALDPPMSRKQLDFAYAELKKRLAKLDGPYLVDAWFSSGFDHGTAKAAVGLLKRAIADGVDRERHIYIGVPAGENSRRSVTIDWIDKSGAAIRMISLRSNSMTFGCPPAAEPADWTSDVTIVDEGVTTKIPAFRILTVQERCKVTLRIVTSVGRSGLASVGHTDMCEVTTIDRLRRTIDDAADQLRNGQSYRAHPGVVVVYNDSMGSDQEEILRACLGDLTLEIDKATAKVVNQFYGNNGVLRGGRNKAVSAVTYCARFLGPVSVLNADATFPMPPDWLPGSVYAGDGTHLRSAQ